MLPLILAVVGGYLVGDSMKDKAIFADGGEVGQMATVKHYWETFDREKKIDLLIGAGYSKSVANDLSREDWDSLEKRVHNNLRAVLLADGGMMAKGGVLDVIDKYNRMELPKKVYSKGKLYKGDATFINGYNGYTSTKEDGYLVDDERNYLKDEQGNILRSKERRGLKIKIN